MVGGGQAGDECFTLGPALHMLWSVLLGLASCESGLGSVVHILIANAFQLHHAITAGIETCNTEELTTFVPLAAMHQAL